MLAPSSAILRIFKNLSALGLVQLTNYLLPLVTLPYLISHLGIENFGKIAFAQAVIAYLMLVTDYSFNLTATQEISLSKRSKPALAEIVTRVYSAKMILISFALLILLILFLLFSDIRDDIAIYLGGFLFLIGQTLFPVWFFQGIEKMGFITFLNLLSKVIYTILIFSLINSSADIYLVLLLQGIGSLAASIASLFIIIRNYPIKYNFIGFANVLKYLKNDVHVFVSNLSISAYVSSNLIILGIVGNDLVVGYYSVAEKILILLRQVLVIFSQAIFPQVVLVASKSVVELKKFIRKVYGPFAVVMISGCVFLYYMAPYLTKLLTSTESEEIISLMQILVWIPLVIIPQLPYYQTLLAFRMRKSIMYAFGIIAILSVIANIVLTSFFLAQGSAISMLLTEACITVALIYLLESTEYGIKEAFYFGNRN